MRSRGPQQQSQCDGASGNFDDAYGSGREFLCAPVQGLTPAGSFDSPRQSRGSLRMTIQGGDPTGLNGVTTKGDVTDETTVVLYRSGSHYNLICDSVICARYGKVAGG